MRLSSILLVAATTLPCASAGIKLLRRKRRDLLRVGEQLKYGFLDEDLPPVSFKDDKLDYAAIFERLRDDSFSLPTNAPRPSATGAPVQSPSARPPTSAPTTTRARTPAPSRVQPPASGTPRPSDASITTSFPVSVGTAIPTRQPTALPCPQRPRSEVLLEELGEVTPEAQLLDASTPQGMAFMWLLDDEGVDPCTYPTLTQRYGLAVLYYAWRGDNWITRTGWLSRSNECTWSRVVCDEDLGYLIELDLGKYELSNNIDALHGVSPHNFVQRRITLLVVFPEKSRFLLTCRSCRYIETL